jgi:hypothetical protein
MPFAASARRLPGVRFEHEPPLATTVLPRMDVAGLVGFAASGPLHLPVPIEDPERFAAVFGEDPALCRDPEGGATVRGQLGGAVRSYFRGGGRRCWAVRVAGEAASRCCVPLPGLARRRPDGLLEPAELWARSTGSWGDALTVGTVLGVEALDARLARAGDGLEIVAKGAPERLPRHGDVLRLRFADDLTMICAARGEARLEEAPGGEASARIAVGARLLLRPGGEADAGDGEAAFFDAGGRRRRAAASLTGNGERPPGAAGDGPPPLALDLMIEPAQAPPPGGLVEFSAGGGEELWLVVNASPPRGSPAAGHTVRVSGAAHRIVAEGDLGDPAPPTARAERLSVALAARRGGGERTVLAELGLAPGHPRFLGDLPSDERLFGDEGDERELWRSAAQPRFPLCGEPDEEVDEETVASGRHAPPFRPDAPRQVELERGDLFVPLDPPPSFATELGARRGSAPAHSRDGLTRLDAALFLDPSLAGVPSTALLGAAAFSRSGSGERRPRRGIHALLELDEVTLAAAPDAVHDGWDPEAEVSVPPPEPSPPPPRPEWWRCPRPGSVEPLAELPRHRFLACDVEPPPTPRWLDGFPRGDETGSARVAWTPVGEAAAIEYAVEEATDPGWADAVEVYRGPDAEARLPGRADATRYYRVRAEAEGRLSEWSAGGAVAAQPARGLRRRAADAGDVAPALLGVHAALLRLGAARGDLLAVLSLPQRAGQRAAIAHRNGLAGELAGDTAALGFGALYHPWLTVADGEGPSRLRDAPPDGAALGVLARRARERGAWVAPANEELRDTVAVPDQPDEAGLLALLDGQVNAVRHEPAGFLCLSAETLAEDPALRPVNVRRLLMLLRRAALLHGPRYAFEPNGPALRRGVQRGFEAILDLLFRRGAFAGARPEQAYRVEVSDDPRRGERGELLIELKVAPARPLAFLTVRLVHRGERGLVVEAAG